MKKTPQTEPAADTSAASLLPPEVMETERLTLQLDEMNAQHAAAGAVSAQASQQFTETLRASADISQPKVITTLRTLKDQQEFALVKQTLVESEAEEVQTARDAVARQAINAINRQLMEAAALQNELLAQAANNIFDDIESARDALSTHKSVSRFNEQQIDVPWSSDGPLSTSLIERIIKTAKQLVPELAALREKSNAAVEPAATH